MTLSSEGTAASAWPLLLIGRMDQSTRASSVWGVQSSSGSDRAIAEGDLRYLRIERKADCANAPVQTGGRFLEPVQPREKLALSSSACLHRQGYRSLLGL